MANSYVIPKSQNMFSHLTNDKALKDYKRETARKLVQKQEELLRNLSKVRSDMEQEESQIGKAKDYYSGSRKDKFEHTLQQADKLRHQRLVDKEIDEVMKAASAEPKSPIISASYSTSNSDLHKPMNTGYKTSSDTLTLSKPYLGVGTSTSNLSEIQKLKDQVEDIANRYKSDTDEGMTRFNLHESEYYPGACYVKDVEPLEGRQFLVSGSDIAQYFPVTRYVLY
ncbi:uncharacterized protein [Watersipora subatra]|uniref:uncharacterized protein n=1 Tax=Watersipora subatra TaxID=2589382 RepID=UPI00355BDBC0